MPVPRLIIACFLLFSIAAQASAQILVGDEFEPHEPIVAGLVDGAVPEGAEIQGGWSCDTIKFIQLTPTVVHIWAPPGEHKLSFRGAWVQSKSVELPSGDVIQALIGFGFIDNTATFRVGPSEPPPPPPPPPGNRWGVIIRESSQQTPSQAYLYQQLRQQLPPKRLYIVDPNQPHPSWLKYVQAARDSQNQLPVLVVVTDAGQIVESVPLPSSVADVRSKLGINK